MSCRRAWPSCECFVRCGCWALWLALIALLPSCGGAQRWCSAGVASPWHVELTCLRRPQPPLPQVPGRQPRQQSGGHQCQHSQLRALSCLPMAASTQAPSHIAVLAVGSLCSAPAGLVGGRRQQLAPSAPRCALHQAACDRCKVSSVNPTGRQAGRRAQPGCHSRGVLALPLWPPAPACRVCLPSFVLFAPAPYARRGCLPVTIRCLVFPPTHPGARHLEALTDRRHSCTLCCCCCIAPSTHTLHFLSSIAYHADGPPSLTPLAEPN